MCASVSLSWPLIGLGASSLFFISRHLKRKKKNAKKIIMGRFKSHPQAAAAAAIDNNSKSRSSDSLVSHPATEGLIEDGSKGSRDSETSIRLECHNQIINEKEARFDRSMKEGEGRLTSICDGEWTSLSSLRNNIFDHIVAFAKLLPKDEWIPLMYSAKKFHLEFLEDLFADSGILFRYLHGPTDCHGGLEGSGCELSSSEMEISCSDAFDALRHWRRSAIFQPLRSMFFVVSGRAEHLNRQTLAILDFLDSLPPNISHFAEMHIYVDDGMEGTILDGSGIGELLQSVARTLCTSLILHTSDLEFSLDSDAREIETTGLRLRDSTSSLRSLCISSSLLSHSSIQNLLLSWAPSLERLENLDLCIRGAVPVTWPSFLNQLQIPALRHHHLAAVDRTSLSYLLVSHPHLITISLGNIDENDSARGATTTALLQLPSLRLVSGHVRDVHHFFRMVSASPAMNIDLELLPADAATDANHSSKPIFDSQAHNAFLELLARHDHSPGALHIAFPDIDNFNGPFFSDNFSTRPEQKIRITELHVSLQCRPSSVPVLLDLIAHWILLFPCVELVLISTGSAHLELSDCDKQEFKESISLSKPRITIHF
ncbi:hypothetical protein SCHPADRAFT_896371 [Schizopora paradoxa]|uniref:Uncharacterized protein n=1 Tax=Schizopora paradoxa TaxID=27342 RepID=A0A0H2R1U6_9AGAM|nr:hypothetical protein SCHPADRAFT_896371 [Schizopora paradoxa]